MSTSSFAIVPRRLRSDLGRALARISAALPRRVQRVGARALRPLTARWPALAELLGIVVGVVKPLTPTASESAFGTAPVANDVAPVDVAALLAELASSDDFAARAEAARGLASVTSAEATPGLVAALRDPSVEVAVEAATALARHPGDAATAALLDVTREGQSYFSPLVRAAALRTLGALDFELVRERVVDAVRDREVEVSLAAIAMLVERDAKECSGVLLELLGNESGYYLPLTRQVAARALASVADADASRRAAALLAHESDPSVREVLRAVSGAPSGP